MIKSEYTDKRCQDLSMATDDLIQKTDALAQDEVSKKENYFNSAKTNRDVILAMGSILLLH